VNTSYVNQDLVGVDSRFASPERFRRMNSFVDFRSDFYSVGILFYLMLTGKHPFYSIDNWELMRKHLFDLAQPVHLVDDEIPIPISKLVSKLMEKKVNDRYQSAKGVLHDLEWMKSEFITDSKLKSICLSAHDYSEHILISQKLHGRDLEKCVLLSAFDNAMKGGFEIALVKGKTGSGKSSLVLELYKTVIEVNGNFIIGKFDQSHSSVPYSAMKQACENLCDLLLKENEETLSRNRRMIQEAVGDEGKLLTDVIKNLHLIIGPQPNVNEAIGKESLNRFNYVFCKFLNVVCSSQHPLVMFIDDLQWADNGSLILLSLLMTNKDIDYMLFVGAYRNNEIDESHPLSVMIKNMKEKRVSMHDIETPNLSMSNVNELISDALHTSQVETYPLTALVVRKTHGNPFFVEQFLRSLSDKKLVWFSYEKKSWIWDIEQIDKLNITDNVVELLIQKMLCLNVPTQNCLKIASCIGSPFSLSTIKLACPDYHNLESAISEGLIVLVFSSSCKKYQFAHDQIQLAASSLIPENDMNSTHFQIGHTIWKKSNDEQLEENLFLVVKLLNSDLNAFIDPNECKDIAKLNLKAGEKANMSTSHELASWYLATGIEWLNKTSFQKNNSTLFLHLHKALSEAYFCLRKYELMEKMIGEVMKNTSSILEVITLISLRIRAFTDQALFKESIEASLEIFEELGESFPKSPDNKLIQSEFHHVQSLLQNKSNDEITKRTTTNETILAVMEISVVSCVASYLSGSKYFPLFVLRNVQLSLIHGVSKWSSDSFASYGCLCGEFKEIREGFRFGQLALFLLDKFETKHSLPKVYASVFISVNPWMKHLHNSLNHLMDAYRVSLEVGAHDYGIFCFIGFCMYSLLSGKPLEKLNETIGSVDNTISKKGFVYITCQFAVRKFLGINTPQLNFEQDCKDNCFDGSLNWVGWVHLTMLSYYNGDYVDAKRWQKKCDDLNVNSCAGIYHSALFIFFRGLIALEGESNSDDLIKSLEIAKDCVSKLKYFSDYSPENFLNKLYLLEAEVAIMEEKHALAFLFFEKSINSAKSNQFINEEALACERAGIHYLSIGNEKATPFLQRSYQLYTVWGAKSKLRNLGEMYPTVLFSQRVSSQSYSGLLIDRNSESQSLSVSELSGSNYNCNDCGNGSKRALKRKRLNIEKR